MVAGYYSFTFLFIYLFITGCGSVLTSDGDVEMDAVIMCGKTLNAGGVACVHNIKNPIVLARKVMEKVTYTLRIRTDRSEHTV